jgi:hypothetical protein
VALKGESATAELAASSSTLRRLGATNARVGTYGEEVLETPTRAVIASVEPAGVTPSSGAGPGERTDERRSTDR